MNTKLAAWAVLFICQCLTTALAAQSPIKVYLLAGQSNMQGQGAVRHFEHLLDDDSTRAEFQHLKQADGSWTQRDDVSVVCIGRKAQGPLSVGFGKNDEKIGPELGFGTVLGDALDEPVLIIKTCWGGRSLKEHYLPPSSGGPGPAYTEFVDAVRDVLADLAESFPQFEDRSYELAGLVWFQGWNDMVDGSQRKSAYTEYEERLANLIRDLRQEFQCPDLPVVIGELGVGGPSARGIFQEAQAKVAAMPEFQGTVGLAKTCELYDMSTHQLFLDDVWKGSDKALFERVGSDRPYHYLGSGKVYYRMGVAFGNKMLELAGSKP